MDNYSGTVIKKPEIDVESFEQIREAILHSADGITTFSGQTFGSPEQEAYTPPPVFSNEVIITSSKPISGIGCLAIQESVAA